MYCVICSPTGSCHRPSGRRAAKAATIPPFSPDDEAFDREAQNRLKQEAFLKAGTRCFNQKGFSGTSLDEIAEQLQVSKGAFYYHFANKEALLTQCFDYTLDQLEQVVARHRATRSTGCCEARGSLPAYLCATKF
jgi:AcrR family transcriptional regulator